MRASHGFAVGAFALVALTFSAPSFARDDGASERAQEPSARHGVQGTLDAGMAKMPTTAKEFVTHAGQDGMAEVALGKVATEHAKDPDVKQFAQRMIDDHSKANQELMSLAKSKGIQPPADVSAEQKADEERLSKLSGTEFDKAYMQHMVHDHDKAVALFKTYSERGDDPDLKQWAEKTLTTLREHERLAKTTAADVGASARISNGGAKTSTRTSQSESKHR